MQCQAKTSKGAQCSRKAQVDSLYCWQHQNYVPPIPHESKTSTQINSPRNLVTNNATNNTTNEDWEPKPNEKYYGKIPKNITLKKLTHILANGLILYRNDLIQHGEEIPDMNHL